MIIDRLIDRSINQSILKTTPNLNLQENVKLELPTQFDSLSVTRLGDLLHFGQLCKACGNNYFAQIAHIISNFVKVSKSFIFLVKSFSGYFYRHLATFYWSHWIHLFSLNHLGTSLDTIKMYYQ